MDAQWKAKWVEALRSGNYRQCKEELRNTNANSYCCLGVLCEVLGADWQGEQNWPVLEGESLRANDGDDLLSVHARRIVGLRSGVQNELAAKNDGGASFSEIADYIEKNL